MQGITEAEYEQALIELFQSLEGKQYRYEYGPDIERDYTNPILDDVLQDSLKSSGTGTLIHAKELYQLTCPS